jgi:hypothetical protein
VTEQNRIGHGMHIYIKDVPKFKKLRESIKSLCYQKYGSALTMGDILLISMSLAKTVLSNEEYLAEGRKTDYSIDTRYGRVG